MTEIPSRISDFEFMLYKINCISNLEYQERIWVRHEDLNIIDSYDDTTMNFEEDAYAILEARKAGRVEMTDTQYDMLKKLYEMVEDYDMSQDRPDEDKEIINDPRWHKIRQYAKGAYDELTRKADPMSNGRISI